MCMTIILNQNRDRNILNFTFYPNLCKSGKFETTLYLAMYKIGAKCFENLLLAFELTEHGVIQKNFTRIP